MSEIGAKIDELTDWRMGGFCRNRRLLERVKTLGQITEGYYNYRCQDFRNGRIKTKLLNK